MHVEVNGTRLWFDVDGPAFVPDGPRLRERPTLLLVHGGPGSYDHSYFKPHFSYLAGVAQVVYVNLRDHGRSRAARPGGLELRAVCRRPACLLRRRWNCQAGRPRSVHGGFIATLYGARHNGHAGALILQSTAARFDPGRLVDGFRWVAGDEMAEFARRDYGGDRVSDEE